MSPAPSKHHAALSPQIFAWMNWRLRSHREQGQLVLRGERQPRRGGALNVAHCLCTWGHIPGALC